jgi:outer membrane receptor protein involved in Fe transport
MKKNFIRTVKMIAYYSIMGLVLQAVIVSLLFASSAEGQNLRDIKVSVNAANVTLEQALQLIEQKTKFKFLYNDEQIPLKEKASVIVDEESLYNILEVFARDYGLTFNRINDQIIVKKNMGETANLVTAVETGTLRGKVTDASTKEPLIGASVSLKGTTRGDYTDSKGNFEIDNIKPGKYTVVASYIGFSATTKTIEIDADKTVEVNFQLGLSVVNLDEVVVTGSVSERTVRESANPVAILSAREIENRNLTYLPEILSTLPGVSTSAITDGITNYSPSSGANYYVYLRGTATGSTDISLKYFLDGAEVYDYMTLTFLDPNQIEKIEVSKGPMSSTLYGAGSSSGVIQIFTKKGKGNTKLELKTMFTSREDKYADANPITSQYTLSVNGGKSDFGYRLSGNYSLFPISRYKINNGIDDESYGFSSNIFGNVGDVKANLSVNFSSNESGSYSAQTSYRVALAEGWVGAERLNTSPAKTDVTTKMTSLDLSLNIRHTIASNIYQDLTLGSSSYDKDYIYNLPTVNTSGTYYSLAGYKNYKRTLKYFINWNKELSSEFTADVTGGVDYRKYKSSNSTGRYTSPYNENATTMTTSTAATGSALASSNSTTGAFAEGVWGYNNELFLTTGFRVETDNSYGENTGWYPMYRVGLTYILSTGSYTFKPRVSWGKSTESIDPSYKVGRTNYIGQNTFIYIGNPDLKPQTQQGYEVGVDIFYKDYYSLSLTYFNQGICDMIKSIYTKPDTYTTVYEWENVASVNNIGFEISGKALIDPLTVEANINYTDSRFGSGFTATTSSTSIATAYMYDGGRVPDIPATTIFARVSYRLPEFLSLCDRRGNIALEYSYKGSVLERDYYNYYRVYCETGKYNASMLTYYRDYGAYSLFNLNLDYSIIKNILLYTNIKNLLNTQEIAGSFTPLSGRRITFGCRLSY